MIKSYDALFALLITLWVIILFIQVWVMQFKEYREDDDGYKQGKLYLLIFNTIFIVSLSPVLAYYLMDTLGSTPSPEFKVFVRILSRLSLLAIALNWKKMYKLALMYKNGLKR